MWGVSRLDSTKRSTNSSQCNLIASAETYQCAYKNKRRFFG